MILPESFWVSTIVRNRNPGPPESDSCIPPLPDSKLAVVPENRPRLVPDVLFSETIFRTAFAVVSTGIPVTRYFPLLPTVPVIVIISVSNFVRIDWLVDIVGAALAAPARRTVLITGEGSHQLTAQELSQFHRYGLKPLIFVLNNNGYLIERLLCKDPAIYYNDLAQWHYHLLPQALGCDGWFTARVTTCAELDAALVKAQSCGTGVYIEVVTDKYVAPPLAIKMHQSTKTLYKN